MNTTSAEDIARAEKPLFPDIDEAVLADCIRAYQMMGCWPEHMDITMMQVIQSYTRYLCP